MGQERASVPTHADLLEALERLAGAVDAHAVRWANAEGVDELVDALELANALIERCSDSTTLGELADLLSAPAVVSACMSCGKPFAAPVVDPRPLAKHPTGLCERCMEALGYEGKPCPN